MPYKIKWFLSALHDVARPRERRQRSADAQGSLSGDPVSPKTRLILLIEDNPAHAELIRRCFEDHRTKSNLYRVADGKAALAYLLRQGAYADERRSPRPHLILLDLRLPKVSGLDVLRQIKADKAFCDIPVVVLTTSEAEQDIERAYARGANGYVVKPGDFARFAELIQEMGAYWLAWNRSPTVAA